MPKDQNPQSIFRNPTQRESARVSRLLRAEVVGGSLLALAALLGFIAANSPVSDFFFFVRDLRVGPASLGLDLTIGSWASDGLLAIFFFLVGLELKREFVAGDLRDPKVALVPVAAALGGVVVPALIYFAFTHGTDAANGWAIPTATDIAFAVAVLGLIAPRIPAALRMFLLTLAVVDDLVAIAIIGVAYTSSLNLIPLALAVVPFVLYAWTVRRFGAWFSHSTVGPWFLLLPLGIVVWALVHASGIHATVAAVALSFTVPVSSKNGTHPAEVFEYRFRPLSAGFAVPVFAFFAAGVSLSGDHNFPSHPVAYGVIAGLVLGKPLGITLTTWLITRFSRARLSDDIVWRDLIGIATLAGVGFTVSLLIVELSLPAAEDGNTARLAVISASLIAIALATLLLARPRRRKKREVLARVGDTGPR